MREFYQNVPKKIENKFSKTFFLISIIFSKKNLTNFSKIKKKNISKHFFKKSPINFFKK